MKKYIGLLLILCVMALMACQQVDTQTTDGAGTGFTTGVPIQTSEPTLPTEPTEPTQPTEPIDEELAAFNTLFGDMSSWYNKALVCQYASPQQIPLWQLFYNGFTGEPHEPTDAEWAELQEVPGFNINYSLIRLPVDKMNQVLTDLFGITLEDVEDAGFEYLVYLESTNCYYMMHTDAMVLDDFNALSVEILEDGTICLIYEHGTWDHATYEVILKPHGDGYRILSNLPLE